jgi:hypothetical protein
VKARLSPTVAAAVASRRDPERGFFAVPGWRTVFVDPATLEQLRSLGYIR